MGYDEPLPVTGNTATQPRDLRTGTPVWMPHGEVRQANRPLRRGFATDVAVIGGGVTGMPAIGPVPGAKGCYAVLGFGGNGITFAAIAAQMFQRMLAGQPDPDAELFAL